LLHGFTGSSGNWAPLCSALADRFQTIAIDLPGHGNSSSPSDPSRYSAERLADDIVQVADEVGADRFALMGYSMGGRMALRCALRHPERISALVLESTSPGIVDSAARHARIASDSLLAESIEKKGVVWFVDQWEMLSLWATPKNLTPERRSALREQRLKNDAQGLANSLRGAGAGTVEPVIDRLLSIDVPSLIIAGALDTAYVEYAKIMERAVPHARMEIIDDAGHSIHFEKPDALADAVRRFLLDSERQNRNDTKESS
jgi:2-succinyl-6-hydroxy-2,4-cyclohexadiene-1-carboxylate synthase